MARGPEATFNYDDAPERGKRYPTGYYKVRITDQAGTGSKVRVLIETKDAEKTWTTVGAHENILWASWIALADAICFKLLKELEKKGFGLK